MCGCFLMSGVKILHFLKDWWKSIPLHQNYTMALREFFYFHYLPKLYIGVNVYKLKCYAFVTESMPLTNALVQISKFGWEMKMSCGMHLIYQYLCCI